MKKFDLLTLRKMFCTIRERARICAVLISVFQFTPGGYCQTNYATVIPDGAWCWYSDPRAIFHSGKLYVGYVRSDGRTALSVFDLTSGTRTDLWTSSWTQVDDHNVPSILVRQDRTLLVAYTGHDAFRYFAYRFSVSTNPVSPSDWSSENIGPDTGTRMSYVNLFQLPAEGGKIYDFSRNLNYNPTVFWSTNGGLTWSGPQIVIKTGTGGTRPYVKYCTDHQLRIHLLYTDGHPRDVANSLYHIYYQEGAFYRSDGTLLKYFTNLPIMHDAGERGSVIYQYSDLPQNDPNQWIPGGRAWCWDIALDTQGYPVCVFSVQKDNVTGTNWYDDRIYYYYARWTGSNWIKRFIAHAGRPLYATEDDYAGGICLDPTDPRIVYISSNARDPFDLANTTNVPLRTDERYELWRGITTDGGLTFEWTSITSNSPVDNIRPYVPRVYGGEPCVLWVRGVYSTYTSFNCSIVGLFTTPVPGATGPSSGTWAVDADGLWTDPANWVDGTVAYGPGNIADFSTIDITSDRCVTVDKLIQIGGLRFGDLTGTENWMVKALPGGFLELCGNLPSISVKQNTATLALPLVSTNGFTKTSPGTLVLSESNWIQGIVNIDTASTTVSDGICRLAHPNAISSASAIYIRNNNSGSSTLELDGTQGSITIRCPVLVACRNVDVPAIRNNCGSNSIAGLIQVNVGGNRVIFESASGWLAFVNTCQYIGTLANARTFVFTGDGNFLFSGALYRSQNNAPVHLSKLGRGTMVVTGVLTNDGTVVISNGVFQLQGARMLTSMITVAGGVFTGTGEVFGSVTVHTNGILAPGNASSFTTLSIYGPVTNHGIIRMTVAKFGSSINATLLKSSERIVFGGTLNLEIIGSDPLTVGDRIKLFDAPVFHNSFDLVLPALPGPGLRWNVSSLQTSGEIIVEMGDCKPNIKSASLENGKLVLIGADGVPGYTYTILASSNLNLPLGEWAPVHTGRFDGTGQFVFTNPISREADAIFYCFQVP